MSDYPSQPLSTIGFIRSPEMYVVHMPIPEDEIVQMTTVNFGSLELSEEQLHADFVEAPSGFPKNKSVVAGSDSELEDSLLSAAIHVYPMHFVPAAGTRRFQHHMCENKAECLYCGLDGLLDGFEPESVHIKQTDHQKGSRHRNISTPRSSENSFSFKDKSQLLEHAPYVPTVIETLTEEELLIEDKKDIARYQPNMQVNKKKYSHNVYYEIPQHQPIPSLCLTSTKRRILDLVRNDSSAVKSHKSNEFTRSKQTARNDSEIPISHVQLREVLTKSRSDEQMTYLQLQRDVDYANEAATQFQLHQEDSAIIASKGKQDDSTPYGERVLAALEAVRRDVPRATQRTHANRTFHKNKSSTSRLHNRSSVQRPTVQELREKFERMITKSELRARQIVLTDDALATSNHLSLDMMVRRFVRKTRKEAQQTDTTDGK